MAEENRCAGCGAELAADAPQGLCPGCLLKRGLETHTFAPEGESSTDDRYVPPTPAELAPLFPDLEILDLVGQGGMGVVYKARQKRLDRFVALKILSPKIGRDPAFAERFTREARAMAMLNHPHIVAVHDFGEVVDSGLWAVDSDGAASAHDTHADESRSSPNPEIPKSPKSQNLTPPSLYYFLMEFVDGVNLRQLLETQKLLPEQALAIVPQICDALQYAHDHGVVHRDIKPANILLDKEGHVKIADFGLAKLMGRGEGMASGGRQPPVDATATLSPLAPGSSSNPQSPTSNPSFPELTAAGQIMGTPDYMAPEQREHPQSVDYRADIYSLGVVFYQMLTGELPTGHFAPPSKKVQIDVRLDAVVLRALEHEPERRYQHVSELKTRVETIATTPAESRATDSASILGATAGLSSSASNTNKRSGFLIYLLCTAFIHGLSLLVTIYVVTSLATSYEKIFADFGTRLPNTTIFVITFSHFVRQFWPLGFLAIPLLLGVDFGICWLIHRLGGRLGSLAWSLLVLTVLGIAVAWSLTALWMPFTKLTQSVADKAKSAEITEKQPANPWIAKLPQGEIELVAISHHPSKGQPWWRPDGTPYFGQPFDNSSGTITFADKNSVLRELVLHTPNSETSVECRNVIGASFGSGNPYWNSCPLYGYRTLFTAFPKSMKTINLSIAVAAGDWKTITKHGPTGFSTHSDFRVDNAKWDVSFTDAIEKADGSTVVTVLSPKVDRETRLIAVDNKGQEHTQSWSQGAAVGDANQLTATFQKLPLKQIKEFRFQTRRYQLIEFRNVATQPLSNALPGPTSSALSEKAERNTPNATGPASASSRTDTQPSPPPKSSANKADGQSKNIVDIAAKANGPWIAKLDNGIEVELFGVSESPSKDRPWWRPDGSPLKERPYDRAEISVTPGAHSMGREIAVQVGHVLVEPATVVWKVTPFVNIDSTNSVLGLNKTLTNVYSVAAVVVPEDRAVANVSVGVAGGEWKTIVETPGHRDYVARVSDGFVTFSDAYEKDSSLFIPVATSITRMELRVVAVGKDGREHRGGGHTANSDTMNQITAKFDKLRLDDIKTFRLQSRPYEWVEFHNVSLQPGQKTDVRIKTSAAARKGSWRRSAAVASRQ